MALTARRHIEKVRRRKNAGRGVKYAFFVICLPHENGNWAFGWDMGVYVF